MNTLFKKHIALIEAVNNSETIQKYYENILYLSTWEKGARDAGGKLNAIDCDNYYKNKGITRPMTAGVWDDWEPSHK
jgi:hypothetical protein